MSEVLFLVPGVWLQVDQEVRQVLQQLLGRDDLRALGQLQLSSQAETIDYADQGTGTIAVLGDDAAPAPAVADPLHVVDTLVTLQI